MPPDPPSKSASGAQQDWGLNEHPYLTLTYAPGWLAIKFEAKFLFNPGLP